jgi:hypothetical protein
VTRGAGGTSRFPQISFALRGQAASPAAEAERLVAWIRLPAIALLALSQGLEHPNPERAGFLITLALYSAFSAGMLALVHLRPAGPRLALAATGVDVGAISVLAVLSAGRSRTRGSRSSSFRSRSRFASGRGSRPRPRS